MITTHLAILLRNGTLSIPENWSIISDKDTRAIDITTDGPTFHKIKGRVKNIIKQTKTDEELIQEFNKIKEQVADDKEITNIYISHFNGERISMDLPNIENKI